ncbi:hypothetical protein ACUNWD_05115 [Sunxiuqinia sp. A32]|uniref:hypothetical protein n=1 Tax=Sunxiuqinia sp. A32 TaxID=3461496 RepID=UPI0040465320
MKKQKLNYLASRLALITLAFTFIVSCSKDDSDNNPDYVGTWVAEYTETQDDVTLDAKEVLTLTENSFIDEGMIKYPVLNVWIKYFEIEGELSVSGNKINVFPNKIGIISIDEETGWLAEDMTYYNYEDGEFDVLLEEFEFEESTEIEYRVDGNKLTMMQDYNMDGDFDDEDEQVVYTRQ